jgi:hypothetical protein
MYSGTVTVCLNQVGRNVKERQRSIKLAMKVRGAKNLNIAASGKERCQVVPHFLFWWLSSLEEGASWADVGVQTNTVPKGNYSTLHRNSSNLPEVRPQFLFNSLPVVSNLFRRPRP